MTDPTPDSPVITDADVVALNQRALLRILHRVRLASTILLVIAGVAVLAWVWIALRNQGVIDDSDDEGFGAVFGGEDLSFKTRVDLLSSMIFQLVFALGLAGVALGIRAYCEVATLNAGGTLTGWNVGDPIESEPDPIDLPRAEP
jgi:hypothetical protein